MSRRGYVKLHAEPRRRGELKYLRKMRDAMLGAIESDLRKLAQHRASQFRNRLKAMRAI